jgi:cation:H+ antiporter
LINMDTLKQHLGGHGAQRRQGQNDDPGRFPINGIEVYAFRFQPYRTDQSVYSISSAMGHRNTVLHAGGHAVFPLPHGISSFFRVAHHTIAGQHCQLFLGIILLFIGAELLVKGGASLARRLGLSPIVVGLTVVAFGTSAPELIVSVGGSLKGHGDIAVGNVVGSNIFNLAVILGLAAIISPLRIQLSIIKIDVPIMIAITLLAAGLILFAALPRAGGLFLLMLLIAYTVFTIRLSRKKASARVEAEFEKSVPAPVASIVYEFVFIGIGLGMLFGGSGLFMNSAVHLARSLGISEAVIGLTIIAAGTSMPELTTSILAAVRGHTDISVGNIIGSNIFNILGILGVAAALTPLRAPGINPLDIWVMVGFSVALLPLLWTESKLQRWEGAALLGGYLVYLWVLWPTG